MDIISKNHLQVIEEINQITNYNVYYGGSLEDYLLLRESEKPIGDLDVLIYSDEVIDILKERYQITNPVPSYFNHFMGEKFTKYNTVIRDIKIDFLVSDNQIDVSLFTSTIHKGMLIPHRVFDYKMEILREWVDSSIPNDMWANEKFSKILKKYEDTNTK